MSLEEIIEEARSEQERMLDDSRRVRVRRRLLTEEPAPQNHRWPFVALAAGAAAIALAALTWEPDPGPGAQALTFSVGDEPGAVRDYLVGSPERGAVRFSDGSTLELEAEAVARVQQVTANGAMVQLEAGRARFDVEHRSSDTEWTVLAGPYRVHVIGTRFSVSWDVERRVFQLDMEEGRVQVRGPDGLRRVVQGTESLRMQVDEGDTGETSNEESARDSRVEPALEANEPEVVAVASNVAVGSSASDETSTQSLEASAPAELAPAAAEPSVPEWQRWASRAQYERACQALRQAELTRMMTRSDLTTLEEVADVLRRGRDERRTSVYLAIRARFPSNGGAANAAFMLGRDHAAEERWSDAESWLRVYLREAPQGRRAAVAHGRLLEVLQHRGVDASAEASRYLERFPNGAHASLAQRLSR